jgi:hypothetical protein
MATHNQRGRDGETAYTPIGLVVAALVEEQRELERERQERIGMSARYHCSLPKKERRALMKEMLQKRRAELQNA